MPLFLLHYYHIIVMFMLPPFFLCPFGLFVYAFFFFCPLGPKTLIKAKTIKNLILLILDYGYYPLHWTWNFEPRPWGIQCYSWNLGLRTRIFPLALEPWIWRLWELWAFDWFMVKIATLVVRSFLSLPFTLCFRIASSSPPLL